MQHARTSMVLALALSLTCVGMAAAQLSAPKDSQQVVIALEPTAMGQELEAWGMALKEMKNGIQVFGVRVFADMKDLAGRSTVEVLIETADGTFNIGSIQVIMGSGLLELVSSEDPSEAFPVEKIRAVHVIYRGEGMLKGSFPQ